MNQQGSSSSGVKARVELEGWTRAEPTAWRPAGAGPTSRTDLAEQGAWEELARHSSFLEQGTEPPTALRALQHWLLTTPGVCALGWVKCRAHISLLVMLCIFVYVTNKKYSSSSDFNS